MIQYEETKEKLNKQVKDNIGKLAQMKNSYRNRIELYEACKKNISILLEKYYIEDKEYLYSLYRKTEEALKYFSEQISEIDKLYEDLEDIKTDILANSRKHSKHKIEKVAVKEKIKEYNEQYKNVKNNFFNNSIYEENTMLNYIETQMKIVEKNNIENGINNCKIKDNGTLLISEIKNKVVLPYTGEEVEEIFEKNQYKYKNIENVIEKNFIRPLDEYKDLYGARWRETFKLLTEREDYTKLEATELAVELFNKRYLHPAIISACKCLDELDVYLDCLDKNELDDFKIFDIKYELYPMVVKENRPFARVGILRRICEILKRIFSKKKSNYNEIDMIDKFSMF